jgi:hypothetical protein
LFKVEESAVRGKALGNKTDLGEAFCCCFLGSMGMGMVDNDVLGC